ncbi:hypothetical protein ACIO87_38340 [Streptomyces sp. NPDC087218]|uniref:hypothetical protein n=1 Tax=Streptomyces sp. NPDC087218 TaxID=3365769 RepID=UPI0038309C32
MSIVITAGQRGALVFADLAQTLGVMRSDPSGHPAELVAARGYKWLLCPRGASRPVADPRRISIVPTVASWKSAADPERFFGGPYSQAGTMARSNSSPAWMSWIGARAALGLLAHVDSDDSPCHVLRLADQYIAARRGHGFLELNCGARSRIVVTAPPPGHRVDPVRLYDARVRATITENGGLRVGFHYFNSEADAAYAAEVAHKALFVSTQ